MRNSVVLGMLSLEKTLDSTWHLRCCIFHIFHKLSSLENCYHLSERSHDVHFLRVPWRSPLEVRHSVVKGNDISSQMAMIQLQRSIWESGRLKYSEVHSYQVALTQSPSMSNKPTTTWPITTFFPKGGQVSQPGWRRGEKEETPAVQDVEIQKSCLLVW